MSLFHTIKHALREQFYNTPLAICHLIVGPYPNTVFADMITPVFKRIYGRKPSKFILEDIQKAFETGEPFCLATKHESIKSDQNDDQAWEIIYSVYLHHDYEFPEDNVYLWFNIQGTKKIMLPNGNICIGENDFDVSANVVIPVEDIKLALERDDQYKEYHSTGCPKSCKY